MKKLDLTAIASASYHKFIFYFFRGYDYIRDAQGNVMATYKSNIDTVAESIVYTVGERHIYGSDRVGMYTYPDTVYPVPAVSTADFQPVWRGYRKYELKNHLGNVTTVVNANKIARDDDANGIIDGFDAIIEGAYDYSPFGVTRKSFEPNYTAGTSGEANPLAPDFRWCFDGVGTEANGSGHDAMLYGMTPTTDRDSQAGNALESQGNANSYMEIQHDADLVFGGNDFTVGIWVKRLALNNNWNHTIAAGKWHSGQQASQNEWYLAISNGGSGNNPPQFAIQAGSTKYTAAGTALPVGSWYHLVGVREGNNIKLYVDGTLVDTEYVGAAVVNTVASRNILLGKMGNGKYLKAGFDEFVVYHRALNATEVNELYGMGCSDFEGEEGVLASGGYRYGFNGKEKDDEVSGKGNQYDYGFRIYNPRLGRFLSTDPLFKSYPWYTPYQFAGNTPVAAIDLDGLEEYLVIHWMDNGQLSSTTLFKIPDFLKVDKDSKEIVYLTMNVEEMLGDGNGADDVKQRISNDSNPYSRKGFKEVISNRKEWESTFRHDEAQMVDKGIRDLSEVTGESALVDAFEAGNFILEIQELTPSQVTFESGSSTLTGRGKEELTKLLYKMILIPDLNVTLEGHTDNVGSEEANMNLSINRANSAKDFLKENGIRGDRIETSGKGETEPVQSNETAGGKAENRRIEVKKQ